MKLATRILNLISGVFAMATGLYIGLFLPQLLSDHFRLWIAVATTMYFLAQLYLQVMRQHPVAKAVSDGSGASQFSS